MDRISLYEKKDISYTKVSNSFIDHYMTDANEAQIKIYLYLLRSVVSGDEISVAVIADRFNYTERDILRSLIYWDKKGLITLDHDEYGNVRGICLNNIEKPVFHGSIAPVCGTMATEEKKADKPEVKETSSVSTARPFYSAGQIREFRENSEVKGLLFMTEQYLGRPLSSSDYSSILYIYDSLHFDVALIEYLIDHCVNSGHRNMRYIESVALDWSEKGIHSVEEARYETGAGRREYYDVLKAFGLSGRNPVKTEMDYIRRWRDEYGFSSELIIEAVNRTMNAISKPSFQYADSILQRWRAKHVSKMSDVAEDDRAHETMKKEKEPAAKQQERSASSTRFTNFKERDYDFSELEKKFARN